MNDDEDFLTSYVIPRYLSARVYRWRAAGMMLTDEDLFLVLIVSMLIWFLISSFGLGPWGFGVLTLDPFGFFFAGLGLAYGITLFHLAFPDDSIAGHLKGKGNVQSLSAWLPRGDQKWAPAPVRRVTK